MTSSDVDNDDAGVVEIAYLIYTSTVASDVGLDIPQLKARVKRQWKYSGSTEMTERPRMIVS